MAGRMMDVIGLRTREDAQRESFGMDLTALEMPTAVAQKATIGMVRFAYP